MTDVFEAWSLPRGEIIVRITDGDRKDAEVVAECMTADEAQARATELNTESWLAERPDGPTMVWGDDWTERLLAILDKPYEAELRVAA